MDPERALLSKVIIDRTLNGVTDAGITREHFADSDARKVFDYVTAFYRDNGTIPTARELASDAPWYDLEDSVEETVGALVDRLHRYHALDLIETELVTATEAYDDGDVDGVTTVLASLLTRLNVSRPAIHDVNLVETGQERLAEYLKPLDRDLRGIPSGFPTIDRATQGFQPGQLCTFVGPPKAGKSTTMLISALSAHRCGYRPLLIGFEMSNQEQAERTDAIEARISHHDLLARTLTKPEIERLRKAINLQAARRDFILSNDSLSTTTLSGVAAKVEQYKPDLLIVDGVYMMQDENGEPPGSPQALTNITRGFKRMAQNHQIPIIITTQVLLWKLDRKRGVTSNSIGYSSSFAQDSDVIIGVEKTDDPVVNKIKIVDARNCPSIETYVQWDWETGEFEELDYNPFEDPDHDSGGDDRTPHEVSF